MSQLQIIWKHLSAAPHRSLFLAGAFQGVFTLLWWVVELAGRIGLGGDVSLEYCSNLGTWFPDGLYIFPFLRYGVLVYHISKLDEW